MVKGDLVTKLFSISRELSVFKPSPKGSVGIFLKKLDGENNLFGDDCLTMVLFNGKTSPELVMLSNLKKVSSNVS